MTQVHLSGTLHLMYKFSTRQVARKLRIGMTTLSRYIAEGKVPAPEAMTIGRYEIRAWTAEDIERVREILPKIENGRKTRYRKQAKKQTKKKKSKP